MGPSGFPVRHDLKLVYASSLAVAILMGAASLAGLLYWSLLYPAPQAASTVGTDAFSLVVICPILLASLWLARRGSLVGLLLWPGALFYVLYIYAFYLISLPINVLFLPYVILAVLSAYALIGLVAGIDVNEVRRRLAGAVPARAAGVVLIVLAALFIVLDVVALASALAGNTPVDSTKHAAWIVDLAVECPPLLFGGFMLWRRAAQGYGAVAGLLFQIGALLAGVPVGALVGALLTGSQIDASSAMLLVIGIIPVALLALFLRAAAKVPGDMTRQEGT